MQANNRQLNGKKSPRVIDGKGRIAKLENNGSLGQFNSQDELEWDILTQARAWSAGTAVGNIALFAGGRSDPRLQYQVSDVVDIYNTDTDQWTVAQISAPRMNLAATTVGQYAIFAGGTTSTSGAGTPSDIVDIYDSQTGQWSVTNLSQGRSFLAATALGNLAIFAGGWREVGEYSGVVDILDVTTGEWSVQELSVPRMGLAATTVANKAIFGGGETTGRTFSDAVDIFFIPEPSSLLLLGTMSLGFLARFQRGK